MAHLVYTDGRSRFEMNLDDDPRFVVDLLAWLGQRATTAPEEEPPPALLTVTGAGPRSQRYPFLHTQPVEEPEAAQVSEPGGMVHDSRIANHEPRTGDPGSEPVRCSPSPRRQPLPEKVCALDGCDEVFQPSKASQTFHERRCALLAARARYLAKAKAEREAKAKGPHRCSECPATFTSGKALGGHKATHRTKGRAQEPRNGVARKDRVTAGIERVIESAPESAPERCDIPPKVFSPNVTPLKAVPAPTPAKRAGPLLKCGSCWQKFADPDALADHEARHAREEQPG